MRQARDLYTALAAALAIVVQVVELRRVNEDLLEANELLVSASVRLREENEHLRTLGKLCLAGGRLESAGVGASVGGKGKGRARGAEREEQGAMLERMAVDRRLAAEEEFARKRLEAARRAVATSNRVLFCTLLPQSLFVHCPSWILVQSRLHVPRQARLHLPTI